MRELIERQAAIDALGERPFVWTGGDYELGCVNQYDLDKLAIETVPPAQPEPRWIPVTERLPKIDMSYPHHEDYLVQYDSGDMDVASWSNVNRFWTDHVTEPYWNCVQFAKVVAWMPLPEPWKGEEDEALCD